MRELQDPGGGFFASTPDRNAVGVLAARDKPFEANVMAMRFFAKLERLAPADEYRGAIGRVLAVVGGRDAIATRGRLVGDLLLAIDETRGVR